MPEPALQAEESLMELAEGQETKRCAACRVVKPVSEYYKDRTHSRGIKTRCKQCLRLCKEAFKNQQRAKSAAEQVSPPLIPLACKQAEQLHTQFSSVSLKSAQPFASLGAFCASLQVVLEIKSFSILVDYAT